MLDLCPEHTVIITERVPSTAQVETLGLKTSKHYYDVEVEVPGCHDDFSGLMGQLYQCRYARGEKFTWDASMEEQFRVATLATTSGQFSRKHSCLDKHQFGATPLVAQADHA